MQPPVNVAKIIPPRVTHILTRLRLLERLEQHREKKLVLILGQAAQGKSTLAVSYAGVSRVPSAWLNLGPEDSEAVNLFYLLVQSLQRALPKSNLSPLLTYPSLPSGPREEIPLYRDWLLTLLSQVHSPVQIIFDGLDRLTPQASAFHFLQVLLEVAPPHLHLLMLSREMPPLKVQELKMRQEAYIIRNEDLTFTPKETRSFFKTVRKLLLPYDLMVHISEITEGWIGGLVLLCEAMERLPEESRERFLSTDAAERFSADVDGYFEESIFSSRSPEIKEFLLKSSILDIVDPNFIQDYLGVGNARSILEDLSAKNLFVQPLIDKEKGWLYRYHQLFKDFLQARFRETMAPEHQQDAYLRAGSLLEAKGDPESAVDYYLQAEAIDRAVAAIEQIGLLMLKQAKTAELARWLQNLPPDLVQVRPWLLFYHFFTGRLTNAQEYFASLQRAYALFQQQQDIRGLLLTLAYLLDIVSKCPHPSSHLTALLNDAEKLLQRTESRTFPYECGLLSCQSGIAGFFTYNLRRCYQSLQTASLLAKEAGDRNLEVLALTYSHLVLSCLGEFAQAGEICREVDRLLESWISPEAQTLQFLCTCNLKIFQGEVEQGAALAHRALELMAKQGLAFMYPVAMIYRCLSLGYLGKYAEAAKSGKELMDLMAPVKGLPGGIAAMHLAAFSAHQGDLSAAGEFAAQARQIMSRKEHPGMYQLLFLQVVEALISYHIEELDPAMEQQLEKTLEEAKSIPSYLIMVEAHWVLTLCRWRQGRLQEAAAHLQAGMEIAARRGSYFSLILGPRDRGRVFTLALELGVEKVWDSLPPLLAQLADMVEPDLSRLSRHTNPKIAGKALELRRDLHRRSLPRLDIRTLGGFRLGHNQKNLDEAAWDGKQPKLLLKALVARGSTNVPQDVLLEDLWPEGEPTVSEKNFRVSLHRLRKTLEPQLHKDFGSSYLRMGRGLLSLDPELCRVDVTEFLSLYESGEEQEEQGNSRHAMDLYKKAVNLYGGDFLSEEPYLPWAENKREELRAVYLELLERLSRLYEKQGTLGRAIDYCKKIIRTDPVSEPTYRRLMTLYVRRGMRSEALLTYEACKKNLATELEVEPDAVTTAIYKKIREST